MAAALAVTTYRVRWIRGTTVAVGVAAR